MFYILLNFRLIFTYRIDVIPTAPKLPIAIFKLQVTKLLIQHRAANQVAELRPKLAAAIEAARGTMQYASIRCLRRNSAWNAA
ncbi:hypothetical protein KL86DPRO_20226 [uncultured delta proteobacterium]|uniref:Uncharacterized protein n=1 Tax=uncultured delta proteobacterium TaxID=34034 RepID=A0A212JWS7_9DELT|nr:hypothetical protein KL86DPRO_20226 [uncultured delta proteobacterium]